MARAHAFAKARAAGEAFLNGRRIDGWVALVALALLQPGAALADGANADSPSQDFAIHGQATFTDQGNLAFTSPYAGANSLPGKAEGRETADVTLFVGVRPWDGAEIWLNPEFDQGFGLNNTLGVAGFPNGEGAKVGRANPYLRLQRLFIRQTIDLSGDQEPIDADLNQLAGAEAANRVVLTFGRFSVPDIFDNNAYAHDAKHNFLNWSLVDAGSFDYAADAWGYTVGGSAEWYQGLWTWRVGVFDLSQVPNGEKLDPNFGQFQIVAAAERRYAVAGKAGSIKVTSFLTRGRMGLFADALALAAIQGGAPDVSLVRQYRSRTGINLNLQQDVGHDVGIFARAGWAGGQAEPYEYTDIDHTISAGVSIGGKRWGRPDDTWAFAGVVNDISQIHRAYLAAGGLGILVGDGRLPRYGTENILETYYDIAIRHGLNLTLDYQFVDNPAYNTERGPVSIFAARLHAQF